MNIYQLDKEIERLEDSVNKNSEDLEKLYLERDFFQGDFGGVYKIQELEREIMESSEKLDILYFRKNAKEYTCW